MSGTYIEQSDCVYVVAKTRVSLDSIVCAFLSGHPAEAIAQAFPVLSLEQVYGAITYYLAHRDDIDRYLDSRRQNFAAARESARDADPMWYHERHVDAVGPHLEPRCAKEPVERRGAVGRSVRHADAAEDARHDHEVPAAPRDHVGQEHLRQRD